MSRYFVLFLLLSVCQSPLVSLAQSPTVGLLDIQPGVSEGYILFTPDDQDSVFLMDNCGQVLNIWEFSEKPGATCYLLENGHLLRTGKDSLEIRDWDNNLLWSYAMTANGLNHHHDIEPLPNGNILCIVNDTYSAAAITAEGRDPNMIGANFRLDKVVEIQPVGTNGANIVWEWKMFDHLIQDFDNTKANYGVVADYPGRLDLNYDNGYNVDWVHANGIDYNAELDQILLSSRHMSELYVIDHSTTTAEAADSTGGNYGKGGEFLWRWGNPQVYRQGTPADRKLFRQHDPKWIPVGFPDDGMISCFNNDGDGSATFSSIHLIDPMDSSGYYSMSASSFLPSGFFWSWSGQIQGVTMYESARCGTQMTASGNFMICQSSLGQFSEVTRSGDVVWVYRNPVGTSIYNQFATVPQFGNTAFRAERYEPTFAGFSGKSLIPQGTIEDQNPISDTCTSGAVAAIQDWTVDFPVVINPSLDGQVHFDRHLEGFDIQVVDASGRIIFHAEKFFGHSLPVTLDPGIYSLVLQAHLHGKTRKLLVQ